MIVALVRRLYHAFVPIGARRMLRLTRFTANRRARAGLWRRTGGRVAAGPIKGLQLAGNTPDDCYGAALLGSYECETHEWLEREIDRGWSAVVNVGSSEGYFSTGLARRLPGATVYAFEMDDVLRAKGRRSAERNGVADRVQALGTANPAALASLPVTSALVICDCEGYERDLLDPVQAPRLTASALLVELHDFVAPGATDTLRERFARTHEVEIVEQQPRDPATWAARVGISLAHAAILAEEIRWWNGAHLPGRWLLLSPRAAA